MPVAASTDNVEEVITLGSQAIPPSAGLGMSQVNYLMVEYSPAGVSTRVRRNGEREERSKLRAFVNDPGRSGPPALEVEADLVHLLEMAGLVQSKPYYTNACARCVSCSQAHAACSCVECFVT